MSNFNARVDEWIPTLRELGSAEQRIESSWQIAATIASNWPVEAHTAESCAAMWLEFSQFDDSQQSYWRRVFAAYLLTLADSHFLPKIISFLKDTSSESHRHHDLFVYGTYKAIEAIVNEQLVNSFMTELYSLLSVTSPHLPLVISTIEGIWTNMKGTVADNITRIDILPVLRTSVLAVTGDNREMLIKKLLSLYLTSHPVSEAAAGSLFELCFSLYRVEDMYNCSTALCCCLEGCNDDLKMTLLHQSNSAVFDMTWMCCNHTDNLLRKRGAYILQQYRALHEAAAWIDDYVSVYQQVDGCTSQHLIDQVWPVLDQMMTSCNCSDDADKTLATFQFVFLQPLFRCLLTAPAPAVRKHTLQRILRNLIALPLEAVVLRWFCTDVISVLDNPVYFVNTALITAEETHLLKLLTSDNLNLDMLLDKEVPVSDIVTSNPGLQLHIFLTQLLIRLHLQQPNLLPYFIDLLCTAVAGNDLQPSMKSFSALKWMLRPLTFDAVREILIQYKVIDGVAFMRLKSYIENKLVTANDLVKKQLYDGLVSLVLCCADMSTCSTAHMLSLLSYIGIPFIFTRHSSLLHHFCNYVLSNTTILDSIKRNSSNSCADAELLGICLSMTNSHSDVHNAIWCELSNLYAAVYTPVDYQRKVLHYAHGWLRIAKFKKDALIGVECANVCDYVSLLLLQSVTHVENGTSTTDLPIDTWSRFLMILNILCEVVVFTEAGVAPVFTKLSQRIVASSNHLVVAVLLQCLAALPSLNLTRDCNVNELYMRLCSMTQPQSEQYWQLYNAIFKGVGEEQNLLVTSIIEEYNSYGAYCDWVFRLKWKCIRVLLAMPHDVQCDVEQLQQLRSTVDQLELSSSDTIENILHCCHMHISAMPTKMHEEVAALLPCLFSTAWNVCMNEQYFNHENVIAFIRFAYSPTILKFVSPDLQQEFFEKVLELGYANKPHLLNILVSEMYPLWKSNAAYITPYVQYFAQLLTSSITLQDDANSPDIINTICLNAEWVIPDKHFIRVVLLALFEEGVGLQSIAENVIDNIISILCRKDHQKISMIGSVLFLEKLYAWQALCVLSRQYVTEDCLNKLLPVMLSSLVVNTHHSIRVHIELFCGQMISQYAGIVLPQVLNLLRAHNHSAQALASYFVILGHYLTCESAKQESDEILDVVFPWMTCGPGLPRAIAQYICIDLLPQSQLMQFSHVRNTFQLLKTNKEIVKLYKRQKVFFDEYNITKKCSVTGLLQLTLDLTGEFIPTHIIPILQETVREYYAEDEDQALADTNIAPPIIANSTENNNRLVLQRKKIVFNELQLKMSEQNLSRESNNLRKRHSIVLCASLIDKVTNLAGMARTCEIFAAEELILHDLSVVQSDVFQNIAVSSSNWLPIREVQETQLMKYLKMCRANGYAILGIEQTDRSKCLSNYTFPRKCVLLLGREKEGIPVEYLQIVDQCIEIPQFGVTRSLNVHVSAALCVWEYTRQQITAENPRITEE